MNFLTHLYQKMRSLDKFLAFRWRLLPSIIFSASLFLTVKITSLMNHVSEQPDLIFLSPNEAQAEASPGPAPTSSESKETPRDPSNLETLDPSAMDQGQYQALENLKEKRKKLEEQEKELPKKEEALKTIEKKIDEKTKNLQEAQSKLESLVKGVDEKEKVNLNRLVKMSEGMKSTEAAAILENIDFPILIEIMELIKPGKASGILAAMAPHKAAYLMTQLALRKKMVKLEGDSVASSEGPKNK